MLMELWIIFRQKPADLCLFLLTTADIYIILIMNLGRCLTHESHCHMYLKKLQKCNRAAEELQCFSADLSLALNPGARAALFEHMQSENITFCSLFTNRLRPFQSSQ